MPKQATRTGQELQVRRAVDAKETNLHSPNSTIAENQSDSMEFVLDDIRSIAEEGRKTEDLVQMESRFSEDLVRQFKDIMNWLDSSFKVTMSSATKRSYPSASEAVLDARGMVSLNDASGKVLALKPLEKLHTQTVLNIIVEVLPQVNDHLGDLRRQESDRLSRIDRAITEITKIIDENITNS